MPKATPGTHAEILEYALSHLERDRDAIQAKIDHIRLELGLTVRAAVRVKVAAVEGDPAEASAAPAAPSGKRVLSEAARKRIAAAQKRRWAEHRKNKKPE
jgi:hypothetical protein